MRRAASERLRLRLRRPSSAAIFLSFDEARRQPTSATRACRRRTAPRGRVLVIACGALAREILALKALNGWEHLDLQCLPAKLHLWPDRIPDAVEAAVAEARGALRRDLRRLCRLRHRRAARRRAAPRSGSR